MRRGRWWHLNVRPAGPVASFDARACDDIPVLVRHVRRLELATPNRVSLMLLSAAEWTSDVSVTVCFVKYSNSVTRPSSSTFSRLCSKRLNRCRPGGRTCEISGGKWGSLGVDSERGAPASVVLWSCAFLSARHFGVPGSAR